MCTMIMNCVISLNPALLYHGYKRHTRMTVTTNLYHIHNMYRHTFSHTKQSKCNCRILTVPHNMASIILNFSGCRIHTCNSGMASIIVKKSVHIPIDIVSPISCHRVKSIILSGSVCIPVAAYIFLMLHMTT